MTKTIPFKQPQPLSKPAESWVQAREEPTPEKPIGPTKRLTVDVPEEVHQRLKVHCVLTQQQISDYIRDLLAKQTFKSTTDAVHESAPAA